MTTSSGKSSSGHSSDMSQEQTQTGIPAEKAGMDSGTAEVSALPLYMAHPDTLPVSVAQPGAMSTRESPSSATPLSPPDEALATAQTDSQSAAAISISPDGTAVLQNIEEGTPDNASPPDDHTTRETSFQAHIGGSSFSETEAATSFRTGNTSGTASATEEQPFAEDAVSAVMASAPKVLPEKTRSDRKKTADPFPTPKHPAFAQTHPVLGVEQSMPPSILSRAYAVPAALPFVFLTLMLFLQVFFSLTARELWIGNEARIAGIFQSVLGGNGMLLKLDGEVYPGLPPLYFWFLYGLQLRIGSQAPFLFFLAAGISALLYLWSALSLGRLVGRLDRRTNLASGIMLLSTACVLGVTHSAGLDLMFAALVLGSCIVLYRAYVSPGKKTAAMVLAFTLAAAATMVNGPPGLLMPVCAITLFALWRGSKDQLRGSVMAVAAIGFGILPAAMGLPLLRLFGMLPEAQTLPLAWALTLFALPACALLVTLALMPRLRPLAGISLILMFGAFILSGGTAHFQWPLWHVFLLCLAALPIFMQATPHRLFRLDFFIGLGAAILLVGTWLAVLYWLHGNHELILNILFKGQLPGGGIHGINNAGTWSYYLQRLPLMVLPWTLLVFFLPWNRLFGKTTREGITASRMPAKEGLAFLWCLLISTMLLLSPLDGKHPHYLLPVLPALTILAARALMGIEGRRAAFFRYSMAGLLVISGLLALFGTLMLFGVLPKPDVADIPWTLPSNGGFFAVAVVLTLSGLLLWLAVGSSRPEGVLIVVAIAAILLGYSIGNLSAPALDPVLSPKQQALMLRAYMDKGYTVASFHVEPGTYTYYAQRDIPALQNLEAAHALAEKGDFALVMPLSEAGAWSGKPLCLQEAHRQWLGRQIHVVLACPAIEGLPPAQDPFKDASGLAKTMKNLLRGIGLQAPVPQQPVLPDGEHSQPLPAPEAPQPAPPEAPKGQAVTPEQKTAPVPEHPQKAPATEIPAPGEAPAPGENADRPLGPEQPEAPGASGQEQKQAPAHQERPAAQEPQTAPLPEPKDRPPATTREHQEDTTPGSIMPPVQPETSPEQEAPLPEIPTPADSLPSTADAKKEQVSQPDI